MRAKKKQAVFKSCRKTEMVCFISIDGMEFEASAGWFSEFGSSFERFLFLFCVRAMCNCEMLTHEISY